MDTALYNNLFKEVSKREEVRFMDYSEAFPTSEPQCSNRCFQFGHWAGKCPFNVRNANNCKPKQQGRVKPSKTLSPDAPVFTNGLSLQPGKRSRQCLKGRDAATKYPRPVLTSPQVTLAYAALSRGLCSTVQPETSTSWDVMIQVHPEAQLQTQNMNMMGDDPEDQAEAAWSQENTWLGRLEQIWSDPGVDHYSRVSAWSSWVRLLVEFNRPEEWLYSAAQGA
ncbi:hypothetical protein Bbelb_282590 [Branchiostoma belcheri]|nr:hypothetical protein Bbelb_282590 [Branchiostoma belcheri]